MALALFFDLDLKGAWIVRGILLLPMLITPIVVGVMWRALLNPDWGLVDWSIRAIGLEPPDWLGSVDMAMVTLILVDCWQWTPFVFIIVFARLQALPRDVFEAADVDGAGPIVKFRRIILPMLMPAIVFAAVFRAVDAFRSFDLIYGLSYGGPARGTTTLAFFSFQNGFQFQNYGYAAAVAYIDADHPHRRDDGAVALCATASGHRPQMSAAPIHRLSRADCARRHRQRARSFISPCCPPSGASRSWRRCRPASISNGRRSPRTIPRCSSARACSPSL